MNNEDDNLNQPSTSSGELRSDEKTTEFPKVTLSLNNNIVNSHDDSECCTNCVTPVVYDHMIAASMVYCDQEDNEDSDDNCCVYTYRGDRQEAVVAISTPVDDRSSSPLMDYLEMDFDPEPPPTVGNAAEDAEDEDIIVPGPTNHHSEPPIIMNVEEPPIPNSSCNNNEEEIIDDVVNNLPQSNDTNEINNAKTPNSELPLPNILDNTNLHKSISICIEERNGCIRRNAETMEVCSKMKRMRVDDLSWIKEMVWLEKDAPNLEVNQIGVSACGAAAVINTLIALRIPFISERVVQTIGTRFRDDNASLVSFLEARAVDCCIPQDLVKTLETVSDSLVTARFFATRNDLDSPIAPWLAGWIKKGAIPILTLNIQRTAMPHSYMPDSWRHQMMYGVAYNPLRPESAQIYLTNPLSQCSMEALRPQLISPSSLFIRRADIVSRWNKQTDLMPLATHSNKHWRTFNVLGQVVNLLREDNEEVQFTNHIVIPTDLKSGITLAMKTSSNFSHELKSVPEL